MIYPVPHFVENRAGIYNFSLSNFEGLADFCSKAKNSSEISFVKEIALLKEEYKLSVKESGITVKYSTDEGCFRALTSLYQLVMSEGDVLSCIEVSDSPEFERRGYMLDISRHRMPKLETIKQLVDMLALLKYNEFQLYMESFCFKYPLFPEVTEGFECLTPEDIIELEKYCNDRFIDLVPNQNCLGHMFAWLSRPEYAHLAVGDNAENETGTINPTLPESLELIKKIFDSLLPYFKSEYVNIGLDEAFGLGKFQIEKYCREHGVDNVFMDHLEFVSDYIRKKYGKKVSFWADMITNYKDSYKRIPKDSIALEWGYELIQSQVMAEHCIALSEKGVKYYVCPSCNTHFSFTGRFDVTSFNLRTAGEVGKKYGAFGYLVTDWSCGGEGHPHFGIWSFLPAALGGQYSWNTGAEQNGETFKADYIRGAERFVDHFVFGGAKVSNLLYRISNYYLLEPERIHCGSMCGQILQFPLNVTNYHIFFDLKECGDDFYFNNIVRYINDILVDVAKLDMDSRYKREIILNSKMVVLSAELCKVRMNKKTDKKTAKKLLKLIDFMYTEFSELWNYRNYKEGEQVFLKILEDRKADIKALI